MQIDLFTQTTGIIMINEADQMLRMAILKSKGSQVEKWAGLLCWVFFKVWDRDGLSQNDLITINLGGLASQPMYDPTPHGVY